MIDPDHAMAFLDFVVERHRVFQRRQAGAPQPWTDDPVLATRKFTNVFRVLDPGSQFVLTDLIEPDLPEEDLLLRVFLYRHTGALPAWRALGAELGGYPTRDTLADAWSFWQDWRGPERKVFMRAYNVNPFSIQPGTDKLQNIIGFAARHFVKGLLCREFLAEPTWAGKFHALNAYSGIGKFMAMQVLTDYGYGTTFREDEFVVAGPGAKRGAAYVWPDAKPEHTIAWAYRAIRNLPTPPEFQGRLPSSLDVQNCFCEYSKYVRFSGRTATGAAPYRPLTPGPQALPLLPRNW